MTIARCIEVIAQSPQGFDEACQAAVDEASQTVRGLRSLWVKNAECVIDNNKIVQYRINAKLTFEVER